MAQRRFVARSEVTDFAPMTLQTPPGKSCGTCNLCCKVMEVAELAKAPGIWCGHTSARKGCGIHGTHPVSCQVFQCLWLIDPTLPDSAKPERSRVILEADVEGGRLFARCDPATPVAWREEPIYSILKQHAQRTWDTSQTVFAKSGDRVWLITPRDNLDLGRPALGSAIQIAKQRDGTAVVTITAPADPI